MKKERRQSRRPLLSQNVGGWSFSAGAGHRCQFGSRGRSVRTFFTLPPHGGERVEIGMRRAIASSVAIMMMIGGVASYALFGRPAPHKMELSTSAAHAPWGETARMFAKPIAPPDPDLIPAKLA